MFRPTLLFLPALLFTFSCTPASEEEPAPPCADGADLGEVQLSGLAYVDADGGDASIHDNSFDNEEDSPIAGAAVRLFGPEGVSENSSCAGGDFHFGDLDEGAYVVAPDIGADGNCMQRNCTSRFPEALASGTVKIVTMGDSVPVTGHDTLFPERLATLLGGIADIDNTNVAVGGTVSDEWLPGTPHFDSRLAPELSDADVVVMSIGGNDIMATLDVSSGLEAAVQAAHDSVQGIADNVRATVAGMRDINPDIDIIYCIYVDYGQASIFPWGFIGDLVGQEEITAILRAARESLSVEEGILIADLFGASHALEDPLDDYLFDSLHFNDLGHTLYAEEIFLTLGGALIGDSPLGGQSRDNLGLTPTWSLAAE